MSSKRNWNCSIDLEMLIKSTFGGDKNSETITNNNDLSRSLCTSSENVQYIGDKDQENYYVNCSRSTAMGFIDGASCDMYNYVYDTKVPNVEKNKRKRSVTINKPIPTILNNVTTLQKETNTVQTIKNNFHINKNINSTKNLDVNQTNFVKYKSKTSEEIKNKGNIVNYTNFSQNEHEFEKLQKKIFEICYKKPLSKENNNNINEMVPIDKTSYKYNKNNELEQLKEDILKKIDNNNFDEPNTTRESPNDLLCSRLHKGQNQISIIKNNLQEQNTILTKNFNCENKNCKIDVIKNILRKTDLSNEVNKYETWKNSQKTYTEVKDNLNLSLIIPEGNAIFIQEFFSEDETYNCPKNSGQCFYFRSFLFYI